MTSEQNGERQEEGVEVPYEELSPGALRNLIQEFVSRDGVDWGEAGCTLDDKVEEVLGQLQQKKARVVFDLQTQTANIVVRR